MLKFTSFSPRAKLRAAAAVTLTALLLALGLALTGPWQAYSLKSLDLLFRQVSLAPASPQVVVVTVDQPDLDFFKERGVTWPWPRQLYAPIIDFCRRGQARAVIFDILFTEASSYGTEDDRRLAQAVAEAGNVVMPFFLSREDKPATPAAGQVLARVGLTISGPPPSDQPDYRSILAPIPPLVAEAAALGNVQCRPDADGVFRRLPLVAPYQGRWLPILGFAAFQRFQADGPWRFADSALVHDRDRLPLDPQGRLLLKYRGPTRTHQRLSAANMMQSEYLCTQGRPPIYDPQTLAGKWVFVGLTAPGLLDLKASPVSPVYPGVEVHATLLDNLLQGDFLRPVPWWALLAWSLCLTAGVVLVVFYYPGLAPVLGALFLLNLAQAGFMALAFKLSWWADPAWPLPALNLGFILAAAYSYAVEGRQKKAIRGMFAQYMSEAVIHHLLQHPEKLKLGGERRRLTLFFSDLAGFTTLSEGLDPETVVALLNDYLSAMTEIILAEAGTVDKFEGDAIMAFWGAPLDQEDQALRACRAALGQQAALTGLNVDFARRGLPPLSMRIGLHTGEAVVGNLGSQKRFDYTVIGDTVNLASRLEGLNKFYGAAILASEVTVQECAGAVEFRELDLVAVKGREAPVRVYEVLALNGELTPAQAAAGEEFARGLDLYRRGQFSQAAGRFAAALEHRPEDGPAQTFLARCREFQTNPPPPDWDTVFRPEGK